jgi:anti-sigma B factor antagonist
MMGKQISYQTEPRQGYAVVHLTGSVDMSCSPQARKAILDALQQYANLVVDLSKVEYVDSSGVAVLIEGFQVAQKQGHNFSLVGVGEGAMNVLRLARLEQVFSIYATEADVPR